MTDRPQDVEPFAGVGRDAIAAAAVGFAFGGPPRSHDRSPDAVRGPAGRTVPHRAPDSWRYRFETAKELGKPFLVGEAMHVYDLAVLRAKLEALRAAGGVGLCLWGPSGQGDYPPEVLAVLTEYRTPPFVAPPPPPTPLLRIRKPLTTKKIAEFAAAIAAAGVPPSRPVDNSRYYQTVRRTQPACGASRATRF